jgi:dUTP pyrophosphatase
MKMKIIKFYDDAIIPRYQTSGAAGFDFCAHISEPYTLKPGEIKAFGTGVGVEIPKGYELQIRSRSGLAYKHQISLLNGIGTIDSDYRGEIKVALHNDSEFVRVVRRDERVAQLVILPYEQVEFEEVYTLNETMRGGGGFGSTGEQ